MLKSHVVQEALLGAGKGLYRIDQQKWCCVPCQEPYKRQKLMNPPGHTLQRAKLLRKEGQ